LVIIAALPGGFHAGQDISLIQETSEGSRDATATGRRRSHYARHSLYLKIEIQAAVMTIQFEKLKARLLANPNVKAEYDALAPEFEIAAELLRARLRAGLSQAELAARMGTSQSTIARLENGHTLPSTKTLLRCAEATGSRFQVRLSAA
jgi:DNA-binding XRE family transcriptional regulator